MWFFIYRTLNQLEYFSLTAVYTRGVVEPYAQMASYKERVHYRIHSGALRSCILKLMSVKLINASRVI